MTNGYNGWTNWATWNAALWVDNDEGTYRSRTAYTSNWSAAEAKMFFNEVFPNGTPDMEKSDMSDIDWNEIAENWSAE